MKEQTSTLSTEQRTFIVGIFWPLIEQQSYQLPPSPRTECLCCAGEGKAETETPVGTGDFTTVLARVHLLTRVLWLLSSQGRYKILPA